VEEIRKFDRLLKKVVTERGDNWLVSSKFGKEFPSTKKFVLEEGKQSDLQSEILQSLNHLANKSHHIK
jgi:hypothetical protein